MSRWLHVVVLLAPSLVSVFEPSWVARAAAQPSGVLVVATHEGSPPVPRALLTEIAGLRLDGAPLLLGGEAVASYRDTVSREPSRLGADAFDELSQSTRRAIRHVALRQTEEARTLILLTSAERALDALNRGEQDARAVLERWGHQHARAIARSLQVPSVLAIVRVPEGWCVDRVAVTGEVEASTWVTVSPTVQSATLAIAALRERRSLDLTGS